MQLNGVQEQMVLCSFFPLTVSPPRCVIASVSLHSLVDCNELFSVATAIEYVFVSILCLRYSSYDYLSENASATAPSFAWRGKLLALINLLGVFLLYTAA